MSFEELFGTIEKVALLDFLADHVRYSYSAKDIQEYWNSKLSNISPQATLDALVKHDLIKRVEPHGEHYQLNTDNQIIRAVLKQDFEEAKKEADRLSSEGK